MSRSRRFRIVLAAVASLACLALCASSARAAFQSSRLLDNFAVDPSLNTSWTTPALGEPAMQLNPSAHELTGTSGTWSAALWNAQSFAAPVEVWATIHRAGNGDATLYANVSGGTSERPFIRPADTSSTSPVQRRGDGRIKCLWCASTGRRTRRV